MIKHDWEELKDEFCRGHWPTVADFLRSKKIPNNSRTRSNVAGWKQDKIEYQRKVTPKTQEKTAESESEIRLRQQKFALSLQSKGIEKMKDLSVNSIDEARKLVESGMIQERTALGLDEHDIPSTQINISAPTAEFNRMVDGLSYEGILGLIAQVKREKERRSQLSNPTVQT